MPRQKHLIEESPIRSQPVKRQQPPIPLPQKTPVKVAAPRKPTVKVEKVDEPTPAATIPNDEETPVEIPAPKRRGRGKK